jgi:hypothetical protein
MIRPNTTITIPIVSYPTTTGNPGTTRVTWTSSTPKVATITTKTTTKTKTTKGAWSWRPGTTKTVTIRAHKTGTSTITLRSPGARALTIKVRVVPPTHYRAIKSLTLRTTTGKPLPTHIRVGTAMWVKAIPHPFGAARIKATWHSTNRAVARIDRAGRLTTINHGTTTITCHTHGHTTKTRITVD